MRPYKMNVYIGFFLLLLGITGCSPYFTVQDEDVSRAIRPDNGIQRWSYRNIPNTLRDVRELTIDRSGVYYLATATGVGYSQNQGRSWAKFGLGHGLPAENVKSIYSGQNHVAVATVGGISITQDIGTWQKQRKHAVWKSFTPSNGFSWENPTKMFICSRNKLWIGVNGGIVVSVLTVNQLFNKKGGHSQEDWRFYPIDGVVHGIFVDDHASVYLATSQGTQFSAGDDYTQFTKHTEANSGEIDASQGKTKRILSNLHRGIFVENGVVYVATDKGLSIYKDTKWQTYNPPSKSNAQVSMESVYVQNGAIYLASTKNGTYVVSQQQDGPSVLVWTNHRMANGLPSNSIKECFPYKGKILIVTGRAIATLQ